MVVEVTKRNDYTPALYSSPNADASRLGPAMKELNPRQQAVVHYLLDTGSDNFSEAARAAGYSQDGSDGALRVTAHRLKQDPRIDAAIIEEGKRRMGHSLPVFLKTIRTIGGDIAHKDALKAATTGAAMSGVSAISVSKSENHVIHHGSMMDDVRAMATLLGVDAEELLRGRMKDITPEPPQIEHHSDNDISDLY